MNPTALNPPASGTTGIAECDSCGADFHGECDAAPPHGIVRPVLCAVCGYWAATVGDLCEACDGDVNGQVAG